MEESPAIVNITHEKNTEENWWVEKFESQLSCLRWWIYINHHVEREMWAIPGTSHVPAMSSIVVISNFSSAKNFSTHPHWDRWIRRRKSLRISISEMARTFNIKFKIDSTDQPYRPDVTISLQQTLDKVHKTLRFQSTPTPTVHIWVWSSAAHLSIQLFLSQFTSLITSTSD